MFTRTEITEKTGFDNGECFVDTSEVREYFTVENMKQIYGGNLSHDFPELCDQSILDEMAETVISNKWHIK